MWSVISRMEIRRIMLTDKLTPKDFWFQVGQFNRSEITEMKLIGYKLIKDHWGKDVEETFLDTNKFMKQSVLDTHNEAYKTDY